MTRTPNPALSPDTAQNAWELTGPGAGDWRTFSCKLVTPLYGGGVRAAEIDADLPVRPSGIRGQLRFWWRLACGPFESPEAMFRRETAIWGGIAGSGPTASRVAVRVDGVTGLRIEPAFVYQPNRNRPGEWRTMPEAAAWIDSYALFPARGELTKDKRDIEVAPHRLAREGLAYRLHLRLHTALTDAQRREVDTAVRWWASFGGVGARTRRGLGAIQVTGISPVTAEEVAAQGGRLQLRAAENTPEIAWKHSLGRLRDFRQGVELGRNPKSPGSDSPAGRSRWPEPDVIRRQTRRHAPSHAPAHPVETALPRAAFGLPIVFHFKDENKGEPSQQLLVPEDGDRLASPLILRPYWGGQTWHPAAFLLPGWSHALAARVGFDSGPFRQAWPTEPAERRHLAEQIKPMAGRGDDPLSAFLAYFSERD